MSKPKYAVKRLSVRTKDGLKKFQAKDEVKGISAQSMKTLIDLKAVTEIDPSTEVVEPKKEVDAEKNKQEPTTKDGVIETK